jgi:hypothetical protein
VAQQQPLAQRGVLDHLGHALVALLDDGAQQQGRVLHDGVAARAEERQQAVEVPRHVPQEHAEVLG